MKLIENKYYIPCIKFFILSFQVYVFYQTLPRIIVNKREFKCINYVKIKCQVYLQNIISSVINV